MPAMPAMGMAAQRASASLTERGNGNYEGSMQLDSGGTWQATVSVQRGGKTIATKALSLNVAGGM
jgi:Cu(I)/Ag(I) efflux system membrane fusion protein/cobalt-zinc-cadmium efflux system membrane fusion protein